MHFGIVTTVVAVMLAMLAATAFGTRAGPVASASEAVACMMQCKLRTLPIPSQAIAERIYRMAVKARGVGTRAGCAVLCMLSSTCPMHGIKVGALPHRALSL